MKVVHNWHRTPMGRIARFLGSINLAVPVLAFVAAALAWGTYLESTQNVKVARATVYGSWWFMVLMALICVSLVFAVVTRYPWKRKHVGFITVHASLITLIFGGFWSLFGRVEGQLPLEAGTQSNVITTDSEQIETVRHQNGEFQAVAVAPLEFNKRTLTVGGTSLEVVGRWDNSREEAYVSDDAEAPLRAVELSIDAPAPGAGEPVASIWVGEESHGSAPAVEKGLRVHVLPAGQAWVNKQSTASGYIFVAGDKEVPLGAEGTEVVAGWKIESIRRLSRAMVTGAGLEDAAGGPENPAVEVTITDEKGSREQHRAFSNFPDMVMGKPLGGDARSGLKLISRAPDAGGEALFVYGTPPALKVAYIGADGRVQEFESAGGFPWTVQAGPRTITIFNQLTHARAASRLVQAPKGAENRPALLVRLADMSADDAIPLLWRQPTPLPIPVPEGQDPVMVRFGPRLVALPFTIRLTEFRKKDYPGTDMAMSYESDVNVTLGDGSNKPATISMNEPFKGAGWKVYQSGFIGSDVSVFSIMKDPGLPLTYVGCIGLCIGIVLTFYSRPLSTGHPGIPALFGSANGNRRKEQIDVPSVPVCIDDSVVHVPAAGVGAAVPIAAARLEVRPGLDPGAGRRAHHAAGHVCAATGGPAHGTHKLARR